MGRHGEPGYAARVSTERARNRCRERVARIADSALGSEALRREAAAELRRAVGMDFWCWSLGDPGSLIGCSGVTSEIPATTAGGVVPRLMVLEQHDDVLTRHGLARARRPAGAMSAATGGRLARSRRWAECLAPDGFGDLLVLACRDSRGCWGWLEAMRASDAAPYEAEDVRLLSDLSELLGRALRARALQPCEAPATPRPPGLLILDCDLQVTSWTRAAIAWIDALPGVPASGPAEHLQTMPSVVYCAAGRVTATDGEAVALPARARVRTRSGDWAVVEGARLEGVQAGQVAITIRAATVDEMLELLGRIHGLTARERELAALVVAGLDTRQLAQHLVISPHTVKDHLKAIFEKVGVHSRRELTARIAHSTPSNPPSPAAAAPNATPA